MLWQFVVVVADFFAVAVVTAVDADVLAVLDGMVASVTVMMVVVFVTRCTLVVPVVVFYVLVMFLVLPVAVIGYCVEYSCCGRRGCDCCFGLSYSCCDNGFGKWLWC